MEKMSTFHFIPEFEGLYSINEYGVIYSHYRNKLMSPVEDSDGYLIVCLHKNKKQMNRKIHRLVASTFIEQSNKQINHKDGNKKNNFYKNLEYCNHTDNQRHAWKTGLKKAKRGKLSHYAKLDEKEVKEIKKLLNLGLSQTRIAKNYGVTQPTISRIKYNKSWKDIE